MNAVRTVRLLDRIPGQPADDARTVAGFVIEAGIPIPPTRDGQSRQHQALLALKVGESIVAHDRAKWARRQITRKHQDRSYASRRLKGAGFRIWRIA